MRVNLTTILAFAFVLAVPAGALAGEIPESARTACEALRGGDSETAIRESDLATSSHPENPVVWRVRGYVLSQTGDPSGAIAAYVRAVRLNPKDCVAQNNLGTILLRSGNLNEALAAFDAALENCPQYADAINNRGVALERLGRGNAAATAYRKATEVDPAHATAHNNLGAIELQRGNKAGAERAFQRAAALDPSFAAPALNLAMLRDPTLDGAAFQTLIEAAARPGADPALRARAFSAQAARAAAARDFDGARRLYSAAFELRPGDPAVLNNLAVVEDQLGLDRFALAHLTEALRIDPRMAVARNNLGIVYVHRGDVERAENVFRVIVRDDPNFHRAHYNLGVLLASQGRIDEARSELRWAWRLAPHDGAVRYNLGLIARESGAGPARERRAYEAALELDASMPEAHLSLGALLADPATPETLRDPARARQHLVRFLELAPEGDAAGRAQAQAWLRYLDFKRDGS